MIAWDCIGRKQCWNDGDDDGAFYFLSGVVSLKVITMGRMQLYLYRSEKMNRDGTEVASIH